MCVPVLHLELFGEEFSARYILQQNMFHKLALNSQSFSTVRCPGPVIFCFKPDPLPVVSTMLKPNPKGTCRTLLDTVLCLPGVSLHAAKMVGSLPSRTFPINALTRKKLSAEIFFLAHEMRREKELREYKVDPLPVITGFITPITRVIRTVSHL